MRNLIVALVFYWASARYRASGQLLATLQSHTRMVRSAEFSPDGQRIVTASNDDTARVWNASSGQLLAILQGHTEAVVSAVFSRDSRRIVTASDDRTARVSNAATPGWF